MEEQIVVLRNMGFSYDVAEALAEREVSPETAAILSAEEIMGHYLEWQGIHGFTSYIIDALDNAREAEARRKL